MGKKTLCAAALALLLLLAACGGNPGGAPSDALYSHDAFVYDETLSWNSSYTDIVQKYGQPMLTHMDDRLLLSFKYPQIAGMTFDRRQIRMSKASGRMELIQVYDMNDMMDDGMTKGEHLRAALTEKYGKATRESKDGELIWENVYAETRITYSVNQNNLVCVAYENLHDYSKEDPYTDLPSGVLSTDGI